MKPLILKPHPLPVLQYQILCRWTPTDSLARNVHDVSPQVFIFTPEPRDTSSKSSLLVPMPSGEYPPYRTWDLHITFDDITTKHPSSFRYSICPCGVRLFREFHLSKHFNTSRPTPQAADRNHTRKTAWVYQSPPLTLQVGCFHRETISFLVLEGPTVDIILGRWLAQHSPEVRWDSSEILQWSTSGTSGTSFQSPS